MSDTKKVWTQLEKGAVKYRSGNWGLALGTEGAWDVVRKDADGNWWRYAWPMYFNRHDLERGRDYIRRAAKGVWTRDPLSKYDIETNRGEMHRPC